MATSMQDVLVDFQAILQSKGFVQAGLAHNALGTAITWLNDQSPPHQVINVAPTTQTTFDLVEV